MSCQGNLIERWICKLQMAYKGCFASKNFENYELHFFGAKFAKSIHFFRPEMVGISHFF